MSLLQPTPGVYLVKDTDDLVSHCACEESLVTYPGQSDCPWCGCGWLFACIQCRKSFTFARAVRTDRTWEDLARADIRGLGLTESDEAVADWISDMKHLVAGIELDRRYVYLDGAYFPADAGPIEHDGWYAHHELPRAPQTAAIDNPAIIEELLTNRTYWLDRELPNRE